jgi:hypothetical protein
MLGSRSKRWIFVKPISNRSGGQRLFTGAVVSYRSLHYSWNEQKICAEEQIGGAGNSASKSLGAYGEALEQS